MVSGKTGEIHVLYHRYARFFVRKAYDTKTGQMVYSIKERIKVMQHLFAGFVTIGVILLNLCLTFMQKQT